MTLLRTRPTEAPPVGTPAARDDVPGAWLLVATREIGVRAMNKGFLISTVVSIALIGGLTGFLAWQSGKTEAFTVAVVADDTTAAAVVGEADAAARDADARMTLEPLQVSDDAAARAALEAEDADAWLASDGGWRLSGWSEPDGALTGLLTTAVQDHVVGERAAEAGTSMAELSAGSTLETERLDGNTIDTGVVQVAGFVLAYLFLMGAIGYGSQIAGSVLEEKQSRLVEIIATAVPLRQLLAGKIAGNSVIALAQNLLFVAVGLVGVSFTQWSQILPALSVSMLWFVVFFTVGFLAVAALYAAAGALASRMEDLQQTTMPLSFLLMGVFFVTFTAEGTFERVLSFVPLASVVSMPGRVLDGAAAWWEPVLSLALLALFAAGALLLSERAYRGALLQTGGRLTWKAALAAGD